jgi:sulfur carrier protein
MGSVVGVDVDVNGSVQALPDGMTVEGLVERLGYGRRQVVAELNGEPLARERFADVVLQPGNRVEVVRAVAGG